MVLSKPGDMVPWFVRTWYMGVHGVRPQYMGSGPRLTPPQGVSLGPDPIASPSQALVIVVSDPSFERFTELVVMYDGPCLRVRLIASPCVS